MTDTVDLPSGWTMTTVDAVGVLRLGAQRSPDRQMGRATTPYLRAANITTDGLNLDDVLSMDFTEEEREAFGLKLGDVLLAEASGSAEHVGRAAVWQGEIAGCCFQNTIIRLRPHSVVPEFAKLVFRHLAETGVLANAARGVGIQHLGAGRLARLPFPLPPWAEQHRIVVEAERRLAEIGAAEVALNDALSRTWEQDRLIIEAAVTGTLVETEAARSLRTGKAFAPASTLLVPAPVATDLFSEASDPAVACEDGPADGWALVRVDTIGEVRLGRQRAPRYEQGENPTPYLRAANITSSGLDLDDVRTMDFNPAEQAVYALKAGDVLLAEASGSPSQVGRPAIWNDEIPGCCFQNTVIRVRSRLANPRYTWLVFRHFAESGVFAQVARGVGIQHLGAARLAALAFPLPPSAEQGRIVEEAMRRLGASGNQRDAIIASLQRFHAMRRETWNAAVTGKLAPQDPAEEPAEALLSRTTPAEPSRASRRSSKEKAPMTKPRGRRTQAEDQIRPLVDVFAGIGDSVRLPELFTAAGYDRDKIEDVETFYTALRRDMNVEIEVVSGGTRENVEVVRRNAS